MAITVTAANLLSIAPGAGPEIVEGIVANQHLLASAAILDTPALAGWFFSQVAHESGGFTLLLESGYYTTAARIRAVWPTRFPTEGSAAPFVRQPEKLFNNVYGNRLGNGPADSGDGFRFRGRGLIQNTGRANYREMGAAIGVDLLARPELLETFPAALGAAVAFWRQRDLNQFADIGTDAAFVDQTMRINGGTNGLADRREYLRRAKLVRWGVGAATRPPEPVETIVRKGDKGERVREAQRLLVAHGFLPGAVDGDFGSGTEDAVRQFQSARRMMADGVIGPVTWRELRASPSRAAPTVPPPPPPDISPAAPAPDLSKNAGCNLGGLLSRRRK